MIRRKRNIFAAGVISIALVITSGGLAFASGVLTSRPADRVGTFESISSGLARRTKPVSSSPASSGPATPGVTSPAAAEPEDESTTMPEARGESSAPAAHTIVPASPPHERGDEPLEHDRDD